MECHAPGISGATKPEKMPATANDVRAKRKRGALNASRVNPEGLIALTADLFDRAVDQIIIFQRPAELGARVVQFVSSNFQRAEDEQLCYAAAAILFDNSQDRHPRCANFSQIAQQPNETN